MTPLLQRDTSHGGGCWVVVVSTSLGSEEGLIIIIIIIITSSWCVYEEYACLDFHRDNNYYYYEPWYIARVIHTWPYLSTAGAILVVVAQHYSTASGNRQGPQQLGYNIRSNDGHY